MNYVWHASITRHVDNRSTSFPKPSRVSAIRDHVFGDGVGVWGGGGLEERETWCPETLHLGDDELSTKPVMHYQGTAYLCY